MTRAVRMGLVVALGLALACASRDRPAPPSKPVAPQIEVTRAVSRRLSTTERLPAELMPYEAVDLFAKETAFVRTIRVDRGSTVREGEIIAELEAPELGARRAQAAASSQAAESQLATGRAKLAADEATFVHMSAAAKVPGVVAGNDLDVAGMTVQADQSNVAALEKAADAARENLNAVSHLQSYLTITAPFAGQITTRYLHPGALVGPGGGPGATPIVRIETRTRDRLIVPVPEKDAAGVPEGTVVIFTVPSLPGRTFRAPIARISGGVDVTTRTMPVEVDVTDPGAELTPGTFCEVEWPVRRTYPTLFVPASAVASDLQRTFVIRVRGGRAEWVDVTTGARLRDEVEVFGDLREGDEVATRGTDQLPSGAEVAAHPGAGR